jgi:threonine aldolase
MGTSQKNTRMRSKNGFASDNTSTACPQVMDAVVAANSGIVQSYGDDEYSLRLQTTMSEIFKTPVTVFPTVSGTASNALALSAITPSFGKIYCHGLAHINNDECGAPEFFSGGAKLVDVAGENGKFNAETLDATIDGRDVVHNSQPACVSITQACETGMVYQAHEITAIAATAHEHRLKVHMDGARFANALVTLDVSPAEMTWKSGVDVLSLGATKNGCLAAEAVVFFKPELVGQFSYLHKRAGQLLSKMRFVSAQLEAYVADDIWLRNAQHANKMAARLSAALAELPGIELAYPTQSNEVFVRLSDSVMRELRDGGFDVNVEELDGSAARFVTAWNTQESEVDELVKVACRPR